MTYKTTPRAKHEALRLLIPYVKPQEIKEKFGFTYATINHHSSVGEFPKWQKAHSERRKQHEQQFLDEESYQKELRIRLANEELNINEADTDTR